MITNWRTPMFEDDQTDYGMQQYDDQYEIESEEYYALLIEAENELEDEY